MDGSVKIKEGKVVERPLLNVSEACQLLNIHANTLRRWSEQGTIKAYRLGVRGERRFRRRDVVALLEQRYQ